MAEEDQLSEAFVSDTFVGGSPIAESVGGDGTPIDPFVGDPTVGDALLADPSVGDPFVDIATLSGGEDLSGSLGFGGGDFV